MTLEYNQPLDYATVLARMTKEIADKRETFGIITRVIDALKPFDGKPINKRLATAVGAALPGYTVHWDADKSGWMYHISIWGSRESVHSYDNRIRLLVGCGTEYDAGKSKYTGTARYSHADMSRGYDPEPNGAKMGYAYPYFRSAADADAYEATLPSLAEHVRKYNLARDAFNEAVASFAPAGYTVFRTGK